MGVSFITIGNLNIDNIIRHDGAFSLAQAGGNALYSAIGAHIWSWEVGIVSSIPHNYPLTWLDELRKAGIDLSGVHRSELTVKLEEWFFYQADGSRIDHIYAPRDCFPDLNIQNRRLSPNEIEALLVAIKKGSYEGLSFGEFRRLNPLTIDLIPQKYYAIHGCHIAPNTYESQLKIARHMKTHNILTSLDLAKYPNGLEEARLKSLLENVDVFLPSLVELNLIYPGVNPSHAIKRLSGTGLRAIVVKLGNKGSLIWDRERDETRQMPIYPVRSNDLTGAGDAYCGGFLVGMFETGDPFQAAYYGTVSASMVIEKTDLLNALRFNRYQAAIRLKALQAKAAQTNIEV